jgi:hypothetical protein
MSLPSRLKRIFQGWTKRRFQAQSRLRLSLEALEERFTPTTASIALNGIGLSSPTAAVAQANNGPSTANAVMVNTAPTSPSSPPPSFFQAAITLFIDGTFFVIDVSEHNNPALADVQASIALNFPYAGPFAELFLQAGESWAVGRLPGGNNPVFLAQVGLGL